MLDIRSLTRADIPEAAPLVAQFRVTLRGFKGVDSEPDVPAGATELAEYLDAGYPAYLARVDGEAAGYIVCRVDAPCVWGESIYVKAEFRRRGIAGALFGRAEALAASYGEDTVYNYIHPNNHAIIAFLASRGYTVLNLVEVRKPYAGEVPAQKVRVGEHWFDY